MNQQSLEKLAGDIIAKNLDKMCKCIYGLGKEIINDHRVRCGEAFTNYLESAIAKYSKIKTILYRDHPVSLYSFYEHLSVRYQNKIINTSSILNLLKLGHYVIISGTGGNGKSTLFKHLFINTIKETDFIPIFIELREINDLDDNATVLDCIYKSLTNMKFNLEKEYFIKALASGQFIIFLDAFDEVQESKRASVKKEINELCDSYDKNYYIVSSRELGENLAFVGWNKFISTKIQSLKKSQALSLIRNIDYNKETKERFLIQLDNNLYKRYRSFASNPLLLTIMLLTFEQYAEIPEKIHLFYHDCFQALYSRHDASKGGYKRIISSKLASDDFIKVLSSISAISYINEVKAFRSETLLDLICTAKEQRELHFDPEAYKTDLIEAICILQQDGLEYVFSHRSFQEYFTAKYIAELDDADQKKVYNMILDLVPSSINEDIVFDILLEVNIQRLEKNLIIPTMKKIAKLVKGPNETITYFNYIKLIFYDIEHNLSAVGESGIETEEDAVFFGVVRNSRRYSEFVNWVYSRYSEILSIPIPEISKANTVACIKKYGSEDDELPVWSLKLNNDLLKHSELINEIIGHSYFSLSRFSYSLLVLEHLEQKYKSNKIVGQINLPFKRKKS